MPPTDDETPVAAFGRDSEWKREGHLGCLGEKRMLSIGNPSGCLPPWNDAEARCADTIVPAGESEAGCCASAGPENRQLEKREARKSVCTAILSVHVSSSCSISQRRLCLLSLNMFSASSFGDLELRRFQRLALPIAWRRSRPLRFFLKWQTKGRTPNELPLGYRTKRNRKKEREKEKRKRPIETASVQAKGRSECGGEASPDP